MEESKSEEVIVEAVNSPIYIFDPSTAETNLVIPVGYTSIIRKAGTDTQENKTLASVSIPDGVTEIGRAAFYNCTRLTSISIPGSVTTMGTSAFAGCLALASISIANGVSMIGSLAFESCKALVSITLPCTITDIRPLTFENCSSLTSVTIPAGIKSIGVGAFNSCGNLATVWIKAPVPPILGSSVFSGAADVRIETPAASIEAYKKADGWKDYAAKIIGR